jgi:sarcosine oxidase, subunit gamma
MSSAVRRESPLSSRCDGKIEVAGLSVREHPFRTLLNLRGRCDDEGYSLAVNDATGLSLPAPNQFNADGERLLAWLGPDEFLFVGDAGSGMEKRLRDRLSGALSALTDVSSAFTTLNVSGPGARDFLAKGWALDLHPRVFQPGHCAQSYLAKAPALLLQRDAAPAFEVIVRRSFADYLWAWLMANAIVP